MATLGMALSLSGCSTLPSLTTGSVTETAPKVADTSHMTPQARALQVGTASARAIKCGYNFDPASLKSNYLAAEASAGLGVAQIGTLERVYDTGFNGVTKAVTNPSTYCTAAKTAVIKKDLTRHLAGDYSAPARKVAKADDGLFAGWTDTVQDKGPTFGSEAWWEKQKDATSAK